MEIKCMFLDKQIVPEKPTKDLLLLLFHKKSQNTQARAKNRACAAAQENAAEK